MATKISLTIPDYVYHQARQAAETNHRPLADVLNEVLAQAFPAVYVSPERPLMEQEMAAFQAMKNELVADYQGQYIAMHQGQVVDHDPDQLALVARIEQMYANEVVLIKQVSAERYIETRRMRGVIGPPTVVETYLVTIQIGSLVLSGIEVVAMEEGLR
jgi:hypothetical protein